MNKETIIKVANYVSPIYGKIGSFVNTDGNWILSNTPEKFRAYLENMGFNVINCYETRFSTAIAETIDGYVIAYNGNCTTKQ